MRLEITISVYFCHITLKFHVLVEVLPTHFTLRKSTLFGNVTPENNCRGENEEGVPGQRSVKLAATKCLDAPSVRPSQNSSQDIHPVEQVWSTSLHWLTPLHSQKFSHNSNPFHRHLVTIPHYHVSPNSYFSYSFPTIMSHLIAFFFRLTYNSRMIAHILPFCSYKVLPEPIFPGLISAYTPQI